MNAINQAMLDAYSTLPRQNPNQSMLNAYQGMKSQHMRQSMLDAYYGQASNTNQQMLNAYRQPPANPNEAMVAAYRTVPDDEVDMDLDMFGGGASPEYYARKKQANMAMRAAYAAMQNPHSINDAVLDAYLNQRPRDYSPNAALRRAQYVQAMPFGQPAFPTVMPLQY